MRSKILIVVIFLIATSPAYAQKFYPDDPIWIDDDKNHIEKPKKAELSQLYDILENTFGDPGEEKSVRAQNINALGEVPDSSWFTNRIGRNPMTVAEIVRGPDQTDGPDVSQPWTIASAKTEGISPGFRIKDGKGETFFIKFDPKKYPQLATSAELISNKFFYAFGYNVPEYYIVFLPREMLRIDPKTKITVKGGIERQMTEEDVEEVLAGVSRLPDGRIAISASRRIPGEDLGKFKYYGTRNDDPNDIFPHEHRRELRGLRVFSAWLNHDDSRSINTFYTYVTENEKGYIKHYLIDFSSTLGSGSFTIQSHRAGNEYFIEKKPIFKSGLTLGIWDRPWRHYKYPDYPAVGRYESTYFRPELWRGEYQNPAFINMQFEDAFWATKIVMRFTDEIVRAIVGTAKIVDPKAEEYLIQTILGRRDKIVRYYLSQINPLDEFKLNAGSLEFRNLGLDAGLSKSASYQYQWSVFDNDKQTATPIGQMQTAVLPSLAIPDNASPYLMVRIQTEASDQPHWKQTVDVYLRNSGEKTVVGIERENRQEKR